MKNLMATNKTVTGVNKLPECVILITKGKRGIHLSDINKLPQVNKKYIPVLKEHEIPYRDVIPETGGESSFVEYWALGEYAETKRTLPVYRIADKSVLNIITFERVSNVVMDVMIPDDETLLAAWDLERHVSIACSAYERMLRVEENRKRLEAEKAAKAIAERHMNGLLQYAADHFKSKNACALIVNTSKYSEEAWKDEFYDDNVLAYKVPGINYYVLFLRSDNMPTEIRFYVPDHLVRTFIGSYGRNPKYWAPRVGVRRIWIHPESERKAAAETA